MNRPGRVILEPLLAAVPPPQAGPATQDGPGAPLYEQILRDPLLLEALLVVLGLFLAALFAAWIRRVGREGRKRRAVHNFVQGIDCVLRQDWEAAQPFLEQVLACDPENVEARVALGDCHRELGRPAEAERLHMEALEAFGDDRIPTRVSLARDHLAQGRPDRAVPHLEGILALEPRHPEALQLLAEACEGLGRFAEAARALRLLLLTLEGTDQEDRRQALRRKIGRDLTRAASGAEQGGELSQALEGYREALSWNPALTEARAGVIRCLAGIGRGVPKALEEQLEELRALSSQPGFLFLPTSREPQETPPGAPAAPSLRALPGPGGTGGAAAEEAPLGELPATLASTLLQREAPYSCKVCDLALASFSSTCPGCGALGTLQPGEPGFLGELEAVERVLDEVEETEAHFRRLIAALYEGGDGVAERLREAGTQALPVLLDELQSREEPEPLVEILAGMGAGVLPEFLDLHRRRRSGGRVAFLGGILDAFGRRRRVLSLVARAFGAKGSADSFFLGLADSADEEERRAVLDYFIASARPAAFEQLQTFAPVELLNQLARTPAPDLVPLLLAVQPQDLLVDWVLVDPALSIEEALMEAFARARDRGALGAILRRRGFHPGVERSLQALLCHEGVREEARALLASFGPAALAHRVPVLLDPETPEEVRQVLAELVCAAGEAAVEPILRGLGPRPVSIDGKALDLVAGIGPAALPALERVFAGEGGLKALLPGLRRRHLRRRELAVRALARIPGPEPEALLKRLLDGEADPGLRALGDRLLSERGAS